MQLLTFYSCLSIHAFPVPTARMHAGINSDVLHLFHKMSAFDRMQTALHQTVAYTMRANESLQFLLAQALNLSRHLLVASGSPGKLAQQCARHHTFPPTVQSSVDSCHRAK